MHNAPAEGRPLERRLEPYGSAILSRHLLFGVFLLKRSIQHRASPSSIAQEPDDQEIVWASLCILYVS